MRQPTTFGLVTTFTILAFHLLHPCLACNRNSNKKQLKDVRQLTFQDSEWIRAKDVRQYIFRQLSCEEGSAGCDFQLDQVTCYNKGVVNKEVKWICRAPEVKFPYRFGMTRVWCNRILWRDNRPTTYIKDDKNCGLDYTVEYVGDTFACGILIGMVVLYGCLRVHKMYFKSAGRSSSSPSSSEATRLEDISFDDDYIWGRDPPLQSSATLKRASL